MLQCFILRYGRLNTLADTPLYVHNKTPITQENIGHFDEYNFYCRVVSRRNPAALLKHVRAVRKAV